MASITSLGDLRADEADQGGDGSQGDADRFLVAEAGGHPVAVPFLQAREIVTCGP